MNSRSQYFQHLFEQFSDQCRSGLPSHGNYTEDAIRELLEGFAQLSQHLAGDDALERGQTLLCRIIAHFPDLTPMMHRDLLWYFGGDCLHFLSDSELEQYQQLEERYYQQTTAEDDSQSGHYRDLRAKVFGMH